MTTSYFGISGLRKDHTANIQALISTFQQFPAGRVHFDASTAEQVRLCEIDYPVDFGHRLFFQQPGMDIALRHDLVTLPSRFESRAYSIIIADTACYLSEYQR